MPYRTTVGRPAATRQPGIVTASQPWADVAPVVARGFASRLPLAVAIGCDALVCADALAG